MTCRARSSDNPERQRIPARQVSLFILVGIAGILAIGFSPLVLTELHEEGRLPLSYIGYGFTLELLGVGVGTTLCRSIYGRRVVPGKVIATLLALAAINLLSTLASDALVLAARLLAGVIGGVLVGLVIDVIVKSGNPTRVAAWFLTSHTAAQLLMALAVAEILAPRFGSAAGFAAIAVSALVAILPALRAEPLVLGGAVGQAGDGGYRQIRWAALGCVMAVMASLVCVVTYSEIHLLSLDAPSEIAQLAIPIVLIGQILGGSVALVVSNRPRTGSVIPGMLVTIVLIETALLAADRAGIVLVLYAAIGFCWMFLGPLFVGWLLRLDPSRRSAELFAAAQLLGIALGPLAGGAALGALRSTVAFSVAACAAGLVLYLVTGRGARALN